MFFIKILILFSSTLNSCFLGYIKRHSYKVCLIIFINTLNISSMIRWCQFIKTWESCAYKKYTLHKNEKFIQFTASDDSHFQMCLLLLLHSLLIQTKLNNHKDFCRLISQKCETRASLGWESWQGALFSSSLRLRYEYS